jgi:nickel/cobalt exporter
MIDYDSVFFISAQSSLILGLIHGINPCGHSWLIIAPFAIGNKDGKQVFFLTCSFLGGTIMACLLTGLTLGALSVIIPESLSRWVDLFTGVIIILLGVLLIVKPALIHHHHNHDHDHDHEDEKEQAHGINGLINTLTTNISFSAMFVIGFVNMIIPCPTVSVMYKYAVDSGSYVKATAIFGIYGVATAIVVSGVIFMIFKTTNAFYILQKEWIETAVMRVAGIITLAFGVWSIA